MMAEAIMAILAERERKKRAKKRAER